MRWYTEQRQSEPKSGGVYCWASWGIFLCAVFVAILGFAVRTAGQNDQPKPWTKTVSIDVTKPLTEPLQFSLSRQQPQAETFLEFSGNGKDWSFITFDSIPANVALKVTGAPPGYEESEAIEKERFYPFKTRLRIALEIKQEATMPVEIAFHLGSATTAAGEQYLKTASLTPDQVRKFADVGNLKPGNDRPTLKFLWEASRVTSSSPTPTPSEQTSFFQWIANLSDEALLLLFLGFIVVFLVIVFGVLAWSRVVEFIKRVSRRRPKRAKQNQSGALDPVQRELSELAAAMSATAETKHTTPGTMTVYNGSDQTITTKPLPTTETHLTQPWETERPQKPTTQRQIPSSPDQDGNSLELLIEQRVEPLLAALKNKADYEDHRRLVKDTAILLDDKLGQMESKLEQRVKDQESIVLEQGQLMEKKRAEIVSQVGQVNEKGAKIIQQVEDLLKELGQVDARLNDRLAKLETLFHTQTVPDSFYATTLGAVLGQNVETLQDGAFQQLIGERLNDLFEKGVCRGDGLQELRVRAEDISSAIRNVTFQMTKLSPQAIEEARPHVQKVDAFAAELSGLQSQLQIRRATIETPLRIPVSLHPGARQKFLDELGRSIRREIEKLSAPETYFAGELERLITADLIAIVDICDKKISLRPGTYIELETSLNQLFEQAGLRQILPQKGEPFKTSEQDLIEMAQGSGPSLTVAEVITRGFYYNHGDTRTLLRKAGVTVYR